MDEYSYSRTSIPSQYTETQQKSLKFTIICKKSWSTISHKFRHHRDYFIVEVNEVLKR